MKKISILAGVAVLGMLATSQAFANQPFPVVVMPPDTSASALTSSASDTTPAIVLAQADPGRPGKSGETSNGGANPDTGTGGGGGGVGGPPPGGDGTAGGQDPGPGKTGETNNGGGNPDTGTGGGGDGGGGGGGVGGPPGDGTGGGQDTGTGGGQDTGGGTGN